MEELGYHKWLPRVFGDVSVMESKRQRRPNVRFGEIGDASAAFACEVSRKINKRIWGYGFVGPQESEHNHFSEFPRRTLPDLIVSDSGISSMALIDMQYNRENKNPNSVIPFSGCYAFDEIDVIKSKMNLGALAPKCNLVNKGRRSERRKRSGLWNCRMIPEISAECGKKYEGNDTYSPVDEDFTTGKRKMGDYTFRPSLKLQIGGNSIETGKEGDSLEGHNLSLGSFGRSDNVESSCKEVNSVARWLEELGYGRYASVFEMHEVDEVALPLLTIEDLKEMDIAVGPRRKLYTAFRQLRNLRS